jgi:hypothetical protein
MRFAWNWMDGADEQLETDLEYPLPRHGNPPIIHAILYEKNLRGVTEIFFEFMKTKSD